MRRKPTNVALVGAAGYVAARHLDAIYFCDARVVAALDPNDSVGVLDRYDLGIAFFTESERFDRHLEKLRRMGDDSERVHLLSVCSPNHLHDAHVRLGLRLGADVLCEKPLVVNPWNLDPLLDLERESNRRVWTILQLREHPRLRALQEQTASATNVRFDVQLTYVTPRGRWYERSWKGQTDKSGGVPTNIGVHLFDLLLWLFGPVAGIRVHLREERKTAGFLELERATVRWFLSIDPADMSGAETAAPGHRCITVDGERIDFTDGFEGLHRLVYDRTLRGHGTGIHEARPSIELAHAVRTLPLSSAGANDAHPYALGRT